MLTYSNHCRIITRLTPNHHPTHLLIRTRFALKGPIRNYFSRRSTYFHEKPRKIHRNHTRLRFQNHTKPEKINDPNGLQNSRCVIWRNFTQGSSLRQGCLRSSLRQGCLRRVSALLLHPLEGILAGEKNPLEGILAGEKNPSKASLPESESSAF